MALKLSTGLRNNLLGLQATVRASFQGITGAFVDGGIGQDTITDSDSGFVTAGFAPGQVLFCKGATTAGNNTNVTGAVIQDVEAGTISLLTGIVSAEAFIASTLIAAAEGGSLKDVFRDGVLRVYSGSQPSSPDSATNGTLLVTVTVSSGAFVAGAFDNGLEFGTAASGAISKSASETWQGLGLAAGTAGWFRLSANPTDAGGADTTLPRIDGNVGTSGADLNMSSTSIVVGSTYTIDTFTFTLPEYYGA